MHRRSPDFTSHRFAIALAIVLAGAGAAAPSAAGQARAYAVAVPDCGAILDDCVPVCNWRAPDGGRPLAACYNNICYRQVGACEAKRIPRPGRASAGGK